MTAFRLNERELLNWRSFDGFFNGCLLRRAPRQFDRVRQQFDFMDVHYQRARDRFDPEGVTNVRYFTRDAKEPDADAARQRDKHPTNAANQPPIAGQVAASNQAAVPAGARTVADYAEMAETDVMESAKSQPGAAAWNDFSWVSKAARQALREAAGISVPKREFVLWMVGIYLLLVVPVNWLVFRAMGRLEWAWIAVPVVAIGWGIAVIWLAQLDIGFARSETEIAVLEAQNGFPRAT